LDDQGQNNRFDRLEPELKGRIIGAAVGEFCQHGYASASMNRVVRDAGISKGALFKYFGTKAGLFEHIYRSVLEKVKAPLRKARDETAGLPFFSRLQEVIRAGLRMTDSYPLYAAIYYRVIYTGDAPHSRKLLASIQEEGERFLRSIIEEGIKNGDLRADLDRQRAAFVLQSVLDRFLHARYLAAVATGSNDAVWDNGDVEEWINEIMAIFQRGMVLNQEVKE
jgi:AcrR family transcriptional regulator